MKPQSSSLVISLIVTVIVIFHPFGSATATIEAQTENRESRLAIKGEDGNEIELYEESYALIIGVSRYTNGWKQLPGVERDISDVKELLKRQGFQIVVLMDPTRAAFDQAIRHFIGDRGQAENNRLVIYFAGHGHTLKTIDGRELGYLVPSDAPLPGRESGSFKENPVGMSRIEARNSLKGLGLFKEKAVSMNEIESYALQIESKHVLFVFDSCFSGSLFDAMRGMIPDSITSKVAKPVRQFIASGTGEQEVPDNSIFREEFVEGLDGEADLNKDGYVTGSELGMFLEDKVANYSQGMQTPRYGKIRNPKLDKGDFVFILQKPKTKTEFRQSHRLNYKMVSYVGHQNPAKQDNKDTYRLEKGQTLSRELATGQMHSYQITLAADQYVRVVVKQQGIDVKVTVAGPKDEKIAEVDTPSGTQGAETATFVTDASGTYRLDVWPVEEKAPPGSYQISLSELRAATAKERSLHVADKLDEQVRELYDKGMYDRALATAMQVLTIRRKELKADDQHIAEVLTNIGTIYLEKGYYDHAMAYLQQALLISEQASGAESSAVAVALNNLASVYQAKGEYLRAEELYQRALSISRKTAGSNSPYVATILNDLGLIYAARGEYEKAEEALLHVVEIRENNAGPESQSVAVALNNLASVYQAKGEYAEAESLYLRALQIGEKVFGAEHPYVAQSLHNLAALYYAKGEYVRGEPLLLRALSINRKVLGVEHPNVAQSLDNLGSVYRALGQYDKAEPLLLNALAIREKATGADDPDVAISISNLGILYRDKGDYDKAIVFLERALAIRTKALGPSHPYVAESLDNIGLLYSLKNEYQKALRYFNQELPILRATGDKRGEIKALENIGKIYVLSGDKDKSSEYFSQAQRLKSTIYGSRENGVGVAAVSVGTPTPVVAVASRRQDDFSVRITEPSTDGESVGGRITVKGSASMPRGNHLWILARRAGLELWWPQGEARIDQTHGQWSVPVVLGGQGDVGGEFEIAAITVAEKEHLTLQDYLDTSQRTMSWSPIKMPTTTSTPQFRKVKMVTRAGGR